MAKLIVNNGWSRKVFSSLRQCLSATNTTICANFNAGKTQLVSFDWSNNSGSIDVKMDESVVEKKIIFLDAGVNLLF